MNLSERYVKRAELQKYFGVSTRTIARWLLENCPCVRIGSQGEGDPRFKISRVEAWLETRSELARR